MVILHKITTYIPYMNELPKEIFPIYDKKCTSTLKVRIDTYGCQMNVADSEVVAALLDTAGCIVVDESEEHPDAVILNTCSIRDNAEQKIFRRIQYLHDMARRTHRRIIIGVIGCMAERLKQRLIDDYKVDLVAGPDAYLSLPELMTAAIAGLPAINVELSTSETYADVVPKRINTPGISGFISIMRGCNNFCSYCIVPYTRGRERSRSTESILRELSDLQSRGYKEVTLLGQNVNSYSYTDSTNGETTNFAQLLEIVAEAASDMRIRFTTSHPKDMSIQTVKTMARYSNIARHIHLPVQSGSNAVLKNMNRRYTREDYLQLIEQIRRIIPDVAITSDLFSGFHDESEEDFLLTLDLMHKAEFASAFLFKYSERPGTLASRTMPDNIPEDVKISRLERMIALQNKMSGEINRRDIGREFCVLVEASSKRNPEEYFGRTSQNKVVVFPRCNSRPGEFRRVTIIDAGPATLRGELIDCQ